MSKQDGFIQLETPFCESLRLGPSMSKSMPKLRLTLHKGIRNCHLLQGSSTAVGSVRVVKLGSAQFYERLIGLDDECRFL